MVFMCDPLLPLTDDPLETERLLIRRTTLGDADALFSMLSDEETAIDGGLPAPFATVTQTLEYILHLLKRPDMYSVYSLSLRATDTVVGLFVFSLYVYSPNYQFKNTKGTFEAVSISCVLRRDARGAGLMPEAASALMNRMLQRPRTAYALTEIEKQMRDLQKYNAAARVAVAATCAEAAALSVKSAGPAPVEKNDDTENEDGTSGSTEVQDRYQRPDSVPTFVSITNQILFCAETRATNARSVRALQKLRFKFRMPVLRWDGATGNQLPPHALYAQMRQRGEAVGVGRGSCCVIM